VLKRHGVSIALIIEKYVSGYGKGREVL